MFTFRDGGKVSNTTFLSYYSSDNQSLAANYHRHDVLTHLHIAFCKINVIAWPFDYSCETETGFSFNPEPVSLNRIRPKSLYSTGVSI